MVTEKTAYNLAKLILLGLIVHVFILGYVFWTDYNGRKEVSNAARAGCERDRTSRALNAEGWRIAEDARRQGGDIRISVRYAELAAQLEALAQINCTDLYPKASLIP
jgi:hypothetical protein